MEHYVTHRTVYGKDVFGITTPSGVIIARCDTMAMARHFCALQNAFNATPTQGCAK